MSLQAARAKIGLAHRQLEVAWERAKETWDDPVSRALWDHHLGPLEQSVRAASGAIVTRCNADCTRSRPVPSAGTHVITGSQG